MTVSHRVLVVAAVLVAVGFGLPGVGAVPTASAQSISVTAADPPTGEQGTLNLSVLIKGKGFKNGAKAKFYMSGTTDPAGVNVKSTKYVNSTQLVATIDIADAAALALFDIEVSLADGRTGKGTELFSVVAKKIDACTLPDPAPTGGYCFSGVPGLSGCLDTNFGNGTGKVVGPRSMEIGYSRGRGIAIDGAGRTVAVGFQHDSCINGSEYEWAVARYLSDGSLDSAFGLNGTGFVTVAFAGGAFAHSVLVQPDNKIVVVGRAKQTRRSDILPVVGRFNENGTLDASFGTGGIAWVSPGGKSPSGTFYSVTLQSDGKIVASGEARGKGFIGRLNTSGTPDTTFNGNGQYLWTAAAVFNAVTTQRVGSDERMVVAGMSRDSLNHWIGSLWRFTGTGALDSGFGAAGVVRTSFHDVEDGLHYFEDEFMDVIIDQSNRIVAAGYALVSTPPDTAAYSQLALARYDISGALDPSFGLAGRIVTSSGQEYGIGRALAIQSDGRILVAGYSHNNSADESFPPDPLTGVWRFSADGAIDATFGDGGVVPDPLTSGTRAVYWNGMAVQADGRIVCGGYVIIEGTTPIWYAALARFWQ